MEPKTQLVLEEELLQWSAHRWFRFGILLAVILDIIVWAYIFNGKKLDHPEVYFLNVGQGDSSLVLLPDGIKVLIDGGPMDGRLQKNLETILPLPDRYIDLVVITHPQQDHYGGFLEVLKYYKIGAILTDGQPSKNVSWQELEKVIKEKNIPEIVLNTGDIISYQDSKFDILSPDIGETAKDINDLGVVMLLQSRGLKALFTADIGAEKERALTRKFNLDVDVLKTSHHGSKYSSDLAFLKEVSPLVSVIEVGKNTYGHPTPQTLNRLADIGAQVYRTDKDGIVKVTVIKNQLQIFRGGY